MISKIPYILALVLVLGCLIYFSYNDHTEIATVKRFEYNISQRAYRVFTEKDGKPYKVYQVKDEYLRFIFNSSDIVNQIDENKTYKFTLIGIRIPIFSLYETIIRAEEKDKQEEYYDRKR
jgi:hypothetical protein